MARQERTTDLSVTFAERYAEGFVWAVGDWFAPALDITFTERVVRGRRTKVLTQGVPPVLRFSVGDSFWKGPRPYRWGTTGWEPDTSWLYSYIPETVEALLQIEEVTPDAWDDTASAILPGRVVAALYYRNPAWRGRGLDKLFLREQSLVLTPHVLLHFLRTDRVVHQGTV